MQIPGEKKTLAKEEALIQLIYSGKTNKVQAQV